MFPSLPARVLSLFNGDQVVNPEKHLDKFLAICDIHSIIEEDVMVIFFLQTLVGLAYDWYLSLLVNSITYFNDIEDSFLKQYSQAMAYHTLLIKFIQIQL